MNYKLLPCPFCGDEIDQPENIPQADNSEAYMVQCCNCGLTMIEFEKMRLVEAWNHRTPIT